MLLGFREQCLLALDYQPSAPGVSLNFTSEQDFTMAIDSTRDIFSKSYSNNPGKLVTNLTYFARDPQTAAIFSMKVEPRPKINPIRSIGSHILEPHQIEGLLTPEIINTEALIMQLYGPTSINTEYGSLKAFASVSEVYKLLPDAMVSTAIVGIPIIRRTMGSSDKGCGCFAQWWPSLARLPTVTGRGLCLHLNVRFWFV